jgi:hypothetical protein
MELEYQLMDKLCLGVLKRNCFLIPGNSPVGLRLPLNSLPAISKFQREEPLERSPFEDYLNWEIIVQLPRHDMDLKHLTMWLLSKKPPKSRMKKK